MATGTMASGHGALMRRFAPHRLPARPLSVAGHATFSVGLALAAFLRNAQ
jgi:hypothetical protein